MLRRIRVVQEEMLSKKKTILFDEMSDSSLDDLTYHEKDTGLKTSIYISEDNKLCEIVRYGKMRTIVHLDKNEKSFIRIIDSNGVLNIDVKLLSMNLDNDQFVVEYQIYEFEELVSHFIFSITKLNLIS